MSVVRKANKKHKPFQLFFGPAKHSFSESCRQTGERMTTIETNCNFYTQEA